MIVIVLKDGLGNQLFQYATAKATALRHKTDLVFFTKWFDLHTEERPYRLHLFKLSDYVVDIDSIGWQKLPVYDEGSPFYFHPKILEAPDNIVMVGWFSWYRYFADYEKEIIKDIVLKAPLSEPSQIWANRIKSDSCPVSLHVRRGDFMRGELNQQMYTILPRSYYDKAVGLLKENFPDMSLYIFSDDIPWCRKHLHFTVPTHFVDCNDEDHGYEDFELMKLCRHHIIANSSFSYWSALCDDREGGIKIFPRNASKNNKWSPWLYFSRPMKWIYI